HCTKPSRLLSTESSGIFGQAGGIAMNIAHVHKETRNLPYDAERVDLACAFRWTARLNMHEAVANHFSLAVNEDGTQFLMNPNQVHFSRIKASDLILIDANDPETMNRPGAPDPTAWGLHGAVHRNCRHARCVMHVPPSMQRCWLRWPIPRFRRSTRTRQRSLTAI